MNLKVLVARKQRGLTQAQLALKAKVRQEEISLIERAGWIPPVEIRQRLSDELETPVDELFEMTDRAAVS